eukprot:TRINITY_DN39177_c0_g1_i1.p1 TRINITY_DN39177_c0_g1~~TRINITY_DN39177_c0_g1_i1.p1  ORF type:complete len:405 (+),score=68.31 TRINITY_DN39177_c0_g1_i1:84-1298(+)
MPDLSVCKFFVARCSEPVKFLPVLFVTCIIAGLWTVYLSYHCFGDQQAINQETADTQAVVFNVIACLLTVCYVRCILVHPGSIPDTPEWEISSHASEEGSAPAAAVASTLLLQETKRSGDRRSCKWCSKYKPDRCHHCRVCRTCILKMDHHCPWIYNCVGAGNHKYFFLFILYSTAACHQIMWTMHKSLSFAINHDETPFLTMFFLLFGETLAVVIGFAVTLFFLFHVWLMIYATTTIEFCEKALKRSNYDVKTYDRGLLQNVRAVLGEWMLLWLLPLCPPPLRLAQLQAGVLQSEVPPPRPGASPGASHVEDRHGICTPSGGWPPSSSARASSAGAGAADAGSTQSGVRLSGQRRPGAGTGSAPDGSDEDLKIDSSDSGGERTPAPGGSDRVQADPFLEGQNV